MNYCMKDLPLYPPYKLAHRYRFGSWGREWEIPRRDHRFPPHRHPPRHCHIAAPAYIAQRATQPSHPNENPRGSLDPDKHTNRIRMSIPPDMNFASRIQTVVAFQNTPRATSMAIKICTSECPSRHKAHPRRNQPCYFVNIFNRMARAPRKHGYRRHQSSPTNGK